MANQQLIDYIQEQLKKGISEETIKKVLLAAGWQESDVVEGMKSAQGQSPAAAPATVSVSPASAATPTTNEINLSASSPVKSVDFGASSIKSPVQSAFGQSSPSLSDASTTPAASATTSPVSATSSMDMLMSTAASKNNAFFSSTPAEQTIIPKLSSTSSSTHSYTHTFMVVLPWILFLFALIGDAYLYVQMRSLNTQLTAANQNAQVPPAGTVDTVQVQQLTQQITALNEEKKMLSDELSLFVAPQGGSTAELPITLKGKIGVVAGVYNLTTDTNIVVTIKNSKEADIALKSLVGNTAQITGTHPAASRVITVQTVNGSTLQSFQAAAASTSTATTTPR